MSVRVVRPVQSDVRPHMRALADKQRKIDEHRAGRAAIRAPPNGWNSRFRVTDAYLIGLQAPASNESKRGVDFGFKVN
jgi:hypothetical protein